jgi:ABC transporter substrate binding protein
LDRDHGASHYPCAAKSDAGGRHSPYRPRSPACLGTSLGTYLDAARQGVSESGYVEGQNVALEWRYAEGHYDRLPALADHLVSRKVAVIETNSAAGALAAKSATSTILIVFYAVSDPLAEALVASLARPGGNITGVTTFVSGCRQSTWIC